MNMKHTMGTLLALGFVAFGATEGLGKVDDEGLYKIKGKGFVAAIDCRPRGKADDFADGERKIRDLFGIVVSNVTAHSFAIGQADALRRQSGGNVAVFVVDDPTLPMTLSASEERWSMVNVAKISGPDVSDKALSRRLSLLFARACCRVLGGDEAKGVETCFHVVLSAKDLDDITSFDITMGPELAVRDAMEFRGIEAEEFGSYFEACEAGVAPQPTNAVQKAIWDEVHKLPTEPIKIQPEAKPVKKGVL